MKPIVTFNAGSSSLKFAVFDDRLALLMSGQVAGYGVQALQAALAEIEGKGIVLQDCGGVGHRIVHGGTRYTAPVRVDQNIQDDLEVLAQTGTPAPALWAWGTGGIAKAGARGAAYRLFRYGLPCGP